MFHHKASIRPTTDVNIMNVFRKNIGADGGTIGCASALGEGYRMSDTGLGITRSLTVVHVLNVAATCLQLTG